MVYRPVRRGFLLASCASLIGGGALAQSSNASQAPGVPGSQPQAAVPAADEAVSLDDVVVTARKVSENAQNVPISISAISGEQIDQGRTFVIEDLNGRVPSVKIMKTVGNSNAFAIFIRGVGRDNGNVNVEAPVALYVDDVFYPYQVGAITDIGATQRVEVLRGPQGTLYGRNATVGAVKYYSRRPDLVQFEAGASATFGSYHRAEVLGGFSAPVIPDTLATRLDVSYRHYGGYMYDRGYQTYLSGNDGYSVRNSWLWKPSDDLEFYLVLDGTRQRDENNIGTPMILTATDATPRYGSPYIGEHNAEDINNLDAGGLNFQVTRDFTNVTLKSITSYRGFGLIYQGDTTARADVPRSGALQDLDDRTFTQEFQATGSLFADRIDYVAGLYYFDSRTRGTLTRPTFLSRFRQQAQSYAGYLDATFHATDALSISGGVRYTNDSKDVDQSGRFANGTLYSVPSDDSWNSTTYRVGIDYQVTDDVLLYANYNTGFKGGQLNSVEPTSLPAVGVFVPPEQVASTEIGIKSEWFDRRLRVNADYYWMDYTDQTQAILVNNITQLVFADATIDGLEAEVVVRPTNAWTVSASAATLDGQYVNVQAGHPAFTNPDKTIKHGPKLTYRIGTDYTFDHIPGIGGQLVVGGQYSWVDDTWASIVKNPLTFMPAYDVVDVNAVYTFPDSRYSIAISGTNVTDTEYYKIVTNPLSRFYAAPSEWSATLKYKF